MISLRHLPARLGPAALGLALIASFTLATAPVLAAESGSTDIVSSSSGLVFYQSLRDAAGHYVGCTASSTMMMLNFISFAHTGGSNFKWSITTAAAKEASIMNWERAASKGTPINMTMLLSSSGSDPHGWRNALNYYGWGSKSAGVYVDKSYTSFAAAAGAAVLAMAHTGKPVGIMGWAGRHAQFINGYSWTGIDPKKATKSTDFKIVGIWITDPYGPDQSQNKYLTISQWQSGPSTVRFSAYHETDSPYRDPIDGQIGRTEWYGKWVVILPTR